jgi:hypothetical protein
MVWDIPRQEYKSLPALDLKAATEAGGNEMKAVTCGMTAEALERVGFLTDPRSHRVFSAPC